MITINKLVAEASDSEAFLASFTALRRLLMRRTHNVMVLTAAGNSDWI